MENVKVDKNDFYNLVKRIFESTYGEVRIVKEFGERKRYRKVEDDYYKCIIEYYYLIDENNNEIFVSGMPVSGNKNTGSFMINETKEFDHSVITLDEIKEIVKEEEEDYPLLVGIPALIQTISDDDVIKLEDSAVEDLTNAYLEYNNSIKSVNKVRVRKPE